MISETPLVSVLINTKDRDKLIPIAISSALKQIYKNIEIVVVDGASTDKTREVVLGCGDERIKYFYSSDEKMPACWNLGLSKCHGDYIALLDDDDEWYPDKIQKQVDLFTSLDESYGWISCGEEYFDDSKGEIVGNMIPSIRGYIHEQLLENAGIGISGGTTLMFRKSAIFASGNPVANIDYSTDFLLSLWVSKRFKFDYCEEILCKCHVNHIYERARASKLQPSLSSFNKLIQWNNYILDTYRDSFIKSPRLQYIYLRNLALLYSRMKKPFKSLKYVILSIRVSRGRARKNVTLLLKVVQNLTGHKEIL